MKPDSCIKQRQFVENWSLEDLIVELTVFQVDILSHIFGYHFVFLIIKIRACRILRFSNLSNNDSTKKVTVQE